MVFLPDPSHEWLGVISSGKSKWALDRNFPRRHRVGQRRVKIETILSPAGIAGLAKRDLSATACVVFDKYLAG